ncbi:PREDICTED: CBL-interacting serine/threonine-protein kinase 16 [Tarenaya hassleriana]|uniref:CBL-interacting serine/threonine-protein kinase 16 n=1 Tax=Tarenaya hassleriana TaxID=28532 RepID=UPI00053C3926|nr:PREDICTED: CBL-interacting serine/threonine-protein kinase 16 [Tarenaya hassleriana]
MAEEKRILFEKYEVGRLLGTGTFAKVYYGKEISTGDDVAIKIIGKDHVAKRHGMTEQITREISVMRLVRHPNIVELREVLATKKKIFFVMEFISGGELFERLDKGGKLPEDLARRYFQQLISAVDFCHSRGVFHRDIKPENLLVDGNTGDLKVSDFGLSAMLLPEGESHGGGEEALLRTRCGTPAYVAPEVLRKKGYDGATADIWSCGVVLYALLAGFLPFLDENVMAMYTKILKADFEFPPWFSPESKKLISKLLVSDPSKRISISEITRNSWFRKNFKPPMAFTIDTPIPSPISSPPDHPPSKKVKMKKKSQNEEDVSPRSFNAFDFISSMSSGFDLSSLFEKKPRPKRMFTSRLPAKRLKERLEAAAREMDMRVKHVRDCKMKLQMRKEGRKGRLSVTAEVFEVAREVSIVEFCKCSGDSLEYQRFCEDDVRPALKDIVWTWQGDNNSNPNDDGDDDHHHNNGHDDDDDIVNVI